MDDDVVQQSLEVFSKITPDDPINLQDVIALFAARSYWLGYYNGTRPELSVQERTFLIEARSQETKEYFRKQVSFI